jgi:hypothetical protein
MCTQLALEVMCKRSKKEGRVPNFHEFSVKKFNVYRLSKKKTLMFKQYDLLDSIEQGAVMF